MGSPEMLRMCNALKAVTMPLLLGSLVASSAFAQSPTYGVGRAPTAEAWMQLRPHEGRLAYRRRNGRCWATA